MKKGRLLSIQEAAKIIGVHAETLRRWDREGKLPARKLGKRGDRRYRYDDLLKVVAGYEPEHYKDWEILHYGYGFERFPDRFGFLAKFVLRKDGIVAGFAFAVGGLALFAYPSTTEEELINMAKTEIKQKVDSGSISNLQEYTFQFDAGAFREVINPEWWVFGSL